MNLFYKGSHGKLSKMYMSSKVVSMTWLCGRTEGISVMEMYIMANLSKQFNME